MVTVSLPQANRVGLAGRTVKWTVLLLMSLSASSTCAQEDWWQRSRQFRTRYYNVKTDLPEDQASELAAHMDMMAQAYASIFAGLRIRRPAVLDVYLFAEQADYLGTIRTRFGHDATGSWGQCITRDKTISLVAWRGHHKIEAMKKLLQHEGFHQFASSLFPRLPTWANEGLAEVFERGVAMNGVIVLGEFPAGDKRRLSAAAGSGQLKPFRLVFTMPSSEWGHQVRQGAAGVNYLQAWSMAHFFLYADDGKYQAQFLNFLVALNRGVAWEQAFVASFGMPNFVVMENLWREHIDSVAPSDYRETIRRLDFLSAGMLALRKERIYVETLDELRHGLKQIEFHYRSNMFGEEREMFAKRDELFRVPHADPTSDKRAFRLVDNRGREAKRSTSGISEQDPSQRRATVPMNLVTDGVQPRDFKVRWSRIKSREYKPMLEAREKRETRK